MPHINRVTICVYNALYTLLTLVRTEKFLTVGLADVVKPGYESFERPRFERGTCCNLRRNHNRPYDVIARDDEPTVAYCLPQFRDTYVVLLGDEVRLYEERGGLDFNIACFVAQEVDKCSPREIWMRHRAIVVRFRRLQRLWRLGGKHIPVFRRMILRALEI